MRPERPSLRIGVECEGRFKGRRALVVLGDVPTEVALSALAAWRPEHVFIEVGRDVPLGLAHRALAGGASVTLELTLEQLGASPDVPPVVEVMLRLPRLAERVDSLKACDGTFAVSWARVDWEQTRESDYSEDEQLWPMEA